MGSPGVTLLCPRRRCIGPVKMTIASSTSKRPLAGVHGWLGRDQLLNQLAVIMRCGWKPAIAPWAIATTNTSALCPCREALVRERTPVRSPFELEQHRQPRAALVQRWVRCLRRLILAPIRQRSADSLSWKSAGRVATNQQPDASRQVVRSPFRAQNGSAMTTKRSKDWQTRTHLSQPKNSRLLCRRVLPRGQMAVVASYRPRAPFAI